MTPHPSKAGRQSLSREKIVGKAVELLDAEGLEGLSMRRLGEALGVKAMALYHYFPNKDAILDGVAARIIEETHPASPPPGANWKAEMLAGPAAAGRALQAHPNAGWLFLGRHYNTGESLQMLETPLRILYSAGFRGQELVDAAHAIFAYTAGWHVLAPGEQQPCLGSAEEKAAAARGLAPLAVSLAPELRDWLRGMDTGLMALMRGLEARRGK